MGGFRQRDSQQCFSTIPDGQWHSGWTNENLFENCVIESSSNNGAYGYGLWASPPEDEAHGPNGPRNVVYNCDISSPKAGLWMGGMNENWLILYNRFRVDSGPGRVRQRCQLRSHHSRQRVPVKDKKPTGGCAAHSRYDWRGNRG
jgi:hypothetical protein